MQKMGGGGGGGGGRVLSMLLGSREPPTEKNLEIETFEVESCET